MVATQIDGNRTLRGLSENGMLGFSLRVARNPPGGTSIGVDKPDVWGVICAPQTHHPKHPERNDRPAH